MLDLFGFPAGIQLLSRWQSGDAVAKQRLRDIFDAAIAGELDSSFAIQPPSDRVHIGGSVNLMTLSMMNDLYGHESREFYKGDARRYVRTTMLTRLLLGFNKMYISWPNYAFSAEAIGQETMYPDRFPPGSDPDRMLITRDNWQDIKLTDFSTGIPKLLDEVLEFYQDLTGMEPVLQLSAPYSLAADTYGQEPLLADLVHDQDFANKLLDHLADNVIIPWAEHFFARFRNGWVEFSDASGSPFFIGPKNCKEIAIRSLRRIMDKTADRFGHRMYDANYRGDFVAQTNKGVRTQRRRRGSAIAEPNGKTVGLRELMDAKHTICRDYVIRLHDDKIPADFYADEAKKKNVPLFTGIGAGQVDRNSIKDFGLLEAQIRTDVTAYTQAIKSVAGEIANNGYNLRQPPWPGTVYFEDVNSESDFRLIEIIVETTRDNGALTAEVA